MSKAEALERELYEKALTLAALRKAEPPAAIADYAFETTSGAVMLSDLFAGRERLLVIHNMGQGCRYCTLWADGLNGVLHHIEDAMAVVLVSKDPPDAQRRMANDRGWRFRMASHGGGDYLWEVSPDGKNYPGAAVYERKDGAIVRRGRSFFGPGDLYNPVWHLLALGGVGADEWTPQFHYWKRPGTLDDGGENLID